MSHGSPQLTALLIRSFSPSEIITLSQYVLDAYAVAVDQGLDGAREECARWFSAVREALGLISPSDV